jgi:DNA repair protein RadC
MSQAQQLTMGHQSCNTVRGFSREEQTVIANAMGILSRHMEQPREAFCSPSVVSNYLKLRLAGRTREAFLVMFLDVHNRLIADEILFEGTLTQVSVYPREVVKRALELNAAAVIFSHNHPSGSADPSNADVRLTATLSAALQNLDIRVLDHVVVAGATSVSLAERGLL